MREFRQLAEQIGSGPYKNYNVFMTAVDAAAEKNSVKLTTRHLKLLQNSLARRDETADAVFKKVHKAGKAAADPLRGSFEATISGKPFLVEFEPDAELRDTEQVPLLEPGGIEAFVRREVIPLPKRPTAARLLRRNVSHRTLEDSNPARAYPVYALERTTLSRKPTQLIERELKALREEDRLTPDLVFRDPYVLDFLGLKDTYSEKDLENALLREIESFLLELGAGFAFVERQKRITLDGDDYYLDLLFYHRRLRRLMVIKLKLGDFKPADTGQMELCLRWLDRHERQEGEENPLGLILCAGKKHETVAVLELEPRGIHVAEYLTALPPRELLEKRLHEAVIRARLRLAGQSAEGASETSVPARKKRGEQ